MRPGSGAAHSVMYETLGLGTRRFPIPNGPESRGQTPNVGSTARDTFFARLIVDESFFAESGRMRFTSLRQGRSRDWLAGVDDFFSRGGLGG